MQCGRGGDPSACAGDGSCTVLVLLFQQFIVFIQWLILFQVSSTYVDFYVTLSIHFEL